MVEQLFLTVPRGSLQFVIVVFPDHTHLLFFIGRRNLSLNLGDAKTLIQEGIDTN